MSTLPEAPGSLAEHLKRPVEYRSYLPGFAVFEREIRRFFKVPAQTILGPLGSSLLYFAIFKYSVGRLAESAGAQGQSISQGIDYLQFLIPGIMTMEAINASIQNPMSSIMISKWTGTVVDQLMAPLKPLDMWFAYISGAAVRAFLVAAMAWVAGSLFAWQFSMNQVLLLLFCIFITSAIFGSLGIAAGVMCKDWDQIGLILTFVLQPLVFLSGVFFSFSGLPESISWLPYLNPIYYLVSLYRYSVVGIIDIELWKALLFVMGMAGVSCMISLRIITKGKGMRS